MLSIYLCPKSQAKYLPSDTQLNQWMRSLHTAQLISSGQPEALPSEPHPKVTQEFSPGLGVMSLFNRQAHEALLPVELTFETLSFHCAPHPCFLPDLELITSAQCPQCEDLFTPDLLQQISLQLELSPLEQCSMFCVSCQADIQLKTVIFEPQAAFARFWIHLEQVGSSRLNPSLIREWELSLGCSLLMLIAQRDENLEEISGIDGQLALDSQTSADWLTDLLSSEQHQGRNHYRSNRYHRRKQTKRRRR